MKILERGHIYQLNSLDQQEGSPLNDIVLTFVNRELGTEHPGTQTQEVIRALIDRTRHCDNCLRWPGNDLIIWHLQQALVLHEARALGRKAEKGYFRPEAIETGKDGHFVLTPAMPQDELAAPVREPELLPDLPEPKRQKSLLAGEGEPVGVSHYISGPPPTGIRGPIPDDGVRAMTKELLPVADGLPEEDVPF